jgi:hypothetical protein
VDGVWQRRNAHLQGCKQMCTFERNNIFVRMEHIWNLLFQLKKHVYIFAGYIKQVTEITEVVTKSKKCIIDVVSQEFVGKTKVHLYQSIEEVFRNSTLYTTLKNPLCLY